MLIFGENLNSTASRFRYPKYLLEPVEKSNYSTTGKTLRKVSPEELLKLCFDGNQLKKMPAVRKVIFSLLKQLPGKSK